MRNRPAGVDAVRFLRSLTSDELAEYCDDVRTNERALRAAIAHGSIDESEEQR